MKMNKPIQIKQTSYLCGICKTTPDQLSHHKSHLETDKHKTKKELFKLQIAQLTHQELIYKYNTIDLEIILEGIENIIVENKKQLNHMKKLKTTDEATEDLQNITMAEISEMNEQFTISNRDALRDKIHEIHNFLRNNGAGYGMNALKVFNVLYGLKKIEELNKNRKYNDEDLYTKLNLKVPDCKFSYIRELAEKVLKNKKNKDETPHTADDLFNHIDISVLDSIRKDSKIEHLLFYEIPKNIRADVYVQLVKHIESISKIEDKFNVQLSGKVYEYFIGRDASAISELGAYFTDRHIVNYIYYEKLQPKPNDDGSITKMIDMFGGSGGFTTSYIDYLCKNYKDKIDWKTEIDKVFHYDMNEDVIKSAGLEMFSLTGEIPDKANLHHMNSFKDEFDNEKFKLIVTNPPYGGDKQKETAKQMKRNKVKEYIKKILPTITDEQQKVKLNIQLTKITKDEKQELKDAEIQHVCLDQAVCSNRTRKYAHEHNLKANDKEGVSLIMLMDMVDIDGTVCGVLKEGVFFNKAYKDLRHCLIENFNVREVISVPQDQFENTSTKTSIIIFDNLADKKTTSTVKFSEMVVERYEEDKFVMQNGFVYLIENKGDISKVTDKEISRATREELLKNPICSLNGKDYNKKVIECGEGFKLVKLGEIVKFLEKSKRKAGEGKEDGQYNFYTSSDKIMRCDIADYTQEAIIIGDGGIANVKIDTMFSCSDHNFIITSKYNYYLYHFLKGNMDLLASLFNGSVLKNLPKNKLIDLQIPIPTTDQSIQQWIDKISKPFDEKNTKEKKLKTLELEIQSRIKEITENEDCDEAELGSICDIFCGKNLPKETAVKGIYNVYGGGNCSYTHNKYNLEGFNIIISRVGNNSIKLVNEKLYLTDNGFSLIINKNKKYIGYYLQNNNDKILNIGNGSAQKVISKTSLSKIKIPIPKDKTLITALEPKFLEIEKLQDDIKQAETLYKQYIDELAKSAIKQPIETQKEQTLETLLNKHIISEQQPEGQPEPNEEVAIIKIKKSKLLKKTKKPIIKADE
jgi:restriction endonuclease S subunit